MEGWIFDFFFNKECSIFECLLEVLIGFGTYSVWVSFGAGLMEDVCVGIYDEKLR